MLPCSRLRQLPQVVEQWEANVSMLPYLLLCLVVLKRRKGIGWKRKWRSTEEQECLQGYSSPPFPSLLLLGKKKLEQYLLVHQVKGGMV